MNKITTLLMTALVAIAPMVSLASPIDALTARETASRFLGESGVGSRMKAPASPVDLRLVYQEPSEVSPLVADYFVFDTGGGFVIVSGDDRAEAVLAYGDATLDMNDLPCNLQWMLDHYKQQMEWLFNHEGAQVGRMAPAPSTVIAPLLHCTWSQGTPYNDLCPINKGAHCVTGCIATAMAQVMYYWKYPDELPDLPAYVAHFNNIYVPALPGTHLDWDNMLDAYGYMPYTQEQGEAVATLMRYCGQATNMEYGTDGSGSGTWNQMAGMQVFGYSMGALLVHRDDYDADTWRGMMLEDLSNGIPILYTGMGDAGGHAYVVDGYDGYRFHINWGWEGSGNNYFALDAFDVGGMSFSWDQRMSWHLNPPEYDYHGTYDFEVDGLCYKINGSEAAVINRSPQCNSYHGAVSIPERVTSGGKTYEVTAIAYDAFRDCSRLTSVTLPSTIKHIGKYAFKNCTRLASLTLPGSIETIDFGAFNGCIGLTTLTLSDGIKSIGNYAFVSCIRLKRLVVPNSVESIGVAAFMDCPQLTTLMIGDGTKLIEEEAFALCDNLSEVTIGNGTEVIGGWTFYGCHNLKKVTMGEMVDSIGSMAFTGCGSIERFVMMPELSPLVAGEETFDPANFSTATLVVRKEMRDNYICDEIWTKFERIVNLEDEMIPGDVNGDFEVNIADVNAVIDAILGGGGKVSPFDVNGDNEVNIADVNVVIDLILK